MSDRIFISYSRNDKDFALKLAKDLKSAGINVWIDLLDISPGKRWDNAIEEALDDCRMFMVILSPVSVESDDVRDEIAYALDEGKHIIPVLSETCKIPLRIRRFNYVDISTNYESGITKLISTLRTDGNIQIPVITENPNGKTTDDIDNNNRLTAEEWFNKGYYSNDLDQKVECYTNAVRLNPNYADAFNNRGLVQHNTGKYLEAIEDYSKVVELNPDYAIAYYNRGLAYYYINKYEEAIRDYNQAINLNPKDTSALYNRGIAFDKLKRYNEAISDYSEAINLNPRYKNAFYNRGLVFKNSGQNKNAADDFNKYLELGGMKESDAEKIRKWIRDLGYEPKY